MSQVRILIVEHIEYWRWLLSSTLRKEPSFEIVGELEDGLAAVKVAEQMQPAIVLLDIGLPGLNGLQAGGWIRMVAPQAKILFVSEQLHPAIVEASVRIGASAYVLKPEFATDLVPAMRASLSGETFLTLQIKSRRSTRRW